MRVGVSELRIRVLAIEQVDALHGEVLDHGSLEVKGDLCHKAFRVDVRIESGRCAVPCVSKLSASQLQPFVGHRLVGYVATVEVDSYAFSTVSERFVVGAR